MLKKPALLKVGAIGRRRLLRHTREVVVQRLNRRDAGVSDNATRELGERGIRHSGLLCDGAQVALFLVETSQRRGEKRCVLVVHPNL
jgi:hypothetical protein